MTLKEEFLAINTYEEFDKRRGEFRSLPADDDVLMHIDKIFGKFKRVEGEVFKHAPGHGLPLWE